MSESSQNGRYSNSYNENELWLRDTFADVFKHIKPIQEKELRKKYNKSRKITCEQYMPHYLAGSYNNKKYFITPLIDCMNAGIFTEVVIDDFNLPVMIKGSLLLTENPELLDKEQQDFSSLFMQSLSVSDEPFATTKGDISYFGIKRTLIAGSYMCINKIWPAEDSEIALQKGYIHPTENDYIKINDFRGNPVKFLRQTTPTILPLRLDNIELVDSNGKVVFT